MCSPRGSLPTDRRFTGQRWEGDALAGLYDYNARFYDPGLGLFIQADTIVPEPGRPVALNRFAYGYNNPIKYNDPTGHCPGCVQCFAGGPCQQAVNILGQRAGQLYAQAQALCVQHCPSILQAAQTWGEKIVQYAQKTLDPNSTGQYADKGGNTADPGGVDPNDPWRWGSAYRTNYEQYYGLTRDPNYEVHHVLPQQWRDVLAKANINVDDPRWLREVRKIDPTTNEPIHQRLYTDVWRNWAEGFRRAGHTPTAQEIVQYARQLEEQYYLEGTLFYREGAGLPGRIDWDALMKLLQGGP